MPFEPYTASVLLILFFSTFIRSAFGFGDALIAMPLLAVVVGFKTATPLVALVASTIALTILARNWRSVQIRSAWRLIVATVVGIPVGLLFLKGMYEGVLKIVLGIVLTAFSLYQLAKPRLLTFKNEKSAFLFGFIAGILGGAYNTNGPLVVVYSSLRRWAPAVFRATLQGYFFPTGLFILLGHGLGGLWTRSVFHYYLLGLPVVFLSIWLGGRLHHSIPKGKFDGYVYGLLILIGLALIVQTLFAMI
jgi:uncharacterized membrane protein YfcA